MGHCMPELIDKPPRLPQRAERAHKGTSGRVAIVAGSTGMSGAAVLAGLGALRGGAGLVRVYTPEPVWPIIATAEPCLMVTPVAANRRGGIASREFEAEHLLALCEWADVIAVGPGLGRSPGTGRIARALTSAPAAQKLVLIVDADGLTGDPGGLLEACRARPAGSTVFTPHPGEMEHLRRAAAPSGALAAYPPRTDSLGTDSDSTQQTVRVAAATALSESCGAVVLLKGHQTVVTDTKGVYTNHTGNPGMASGGMGDVLTGLIAALAAQSLPAFDAACLAAHVHGTAADVLAREYGPIGYTARDVAVQIPMVLERHYGDEWDGV